MGKITIEIRFNRDLNCVDDKIQTLRDSISVVCDSMLNRFGICSDLI